MVNYTLKGTFGYDKNPIKYGKRGGKVLKIKTKIIKDLKKTQNLSCEEYFEFMQSNDPYANNDLQLSQILLGGEKAIEYILLKEYSLYHELSNKLISNSRSPRERMNIIKKRVNILIKIKKSIYGKVIRKESTNTNYQNNEVWTVKKEIDKILSKKEAD
jgi:hypothetical protein